jgi:hypothetical protein
LQYLIEGLRANPSNEDRQQQSRKKRGKDLQKYIAHSALLRLDPMIDPRRSNPRFQKPCEEKQP